MEKMVQSTTLGRLVTERELFLFQICPAYLSHYKEREVPLNIPLLISTVSEVIRSKLTVWLMHQQRPTLNLVKSKWDSVAMRACVKAGYTNEQTRDFMIKGIQALIYIWNDFELRGYQLSSPRTPINLELEGVVLQTMPDAIFVNPEQDIVVVNFGTESTTRDIVNNLVYRARLQAVSDKLDTEVYLVHYGVGSKTRHQFTSRALCTDQLRRNIYHACWSISDGYDVPVSSRSCTDKCQYSRECYL